MAALSGQAAAGPAPGRTILRWAERPIGWLERDRACWIVLAVAMAAYAVLAMWLTRGTTLFVDGMQIFTGNRGLDPGALLAPLNGHLVLLERSVYAAGYAWFGGDYALFRVIETAGAILAVGLLFVYLRRRVAAPLALAAALVLLFLGSAWEVTIVQDVQTNVYSAAFGIGALLALDRDDRRADVVACVMLLLSLAAWTLGLAFVAIAAVRVATRPGWRRRLWLVAVPIVLYVAWLAWVRLHLGGESQNIAGANLLLVPNFIANEAAAVAGAIAGLNYDFASNDKFKPFFATFTWGAPLAAAALIAVIVRVRRIRVDAGFWAALAGLLVFWVVLSLAYGGGRSPETIRYVYPGAVLVFLVLAEVWRGIRPSRLALVAVFAVAIVSIATNLGRLRDGADYFRSFSTGLRAQLTAIEIARNQVDPSFAPTSPPGSLDEFSAGPYLAAVDRNGSPAYTVGDLARQSEAIRENADSTLVAAERIALAPAGAGAEAGGCLAPKRTPFELAEPLGRRLLIRTTGSANVGVRRFAGTATVALGTVSSRSPARLALPVDEATGPWFVAVTPTAGSVRVCRS